jgi:Papain family cysteine protease
MAVMLPNHGRPKAGSLGDGLPEALEPTAPEHRVPLAVDWRTTEADGPVKDQASCGSCWAFGATGAMQSAWFMATGGWVGGTGMKAMRENGTGSRRAFCGHMGREAHVSAGT